MKAVLIAGAVIALSCAADAAVIGGLAVGGADATNPVYLIDPTTGASEPLFPGGGVWGLGSDNVNGVLYISQGSQLYTWDYDEYGNNTPRTFFKNLTKQGGAALNAAGLTFVNGKLYASEVLDGVGVEASIFEVNLATGVGTPVFTYVAKQFKLNGLCFDDDSQLFYFLDTDTSGGFGLWSLDIFNAGLPVHITDFHPSQGATLAAGLAVNKGRAYLVPGRAGSTNSPIAVYDLTSNTFVDKIANPLGGANKEGGATWVTIPTPGSAVILALGGLVAIRRRSSR